MKDSPAVKQENPKKAAKPGNNCLKDAREFSRGFPDTTDTALFAFDPDALEESLRQQLKALYETNAGYKRVVDRMRDERRWVAPQYGLQ